MSIVIVICTAEKCSNEGADLLCGLVRNQMCLIERWLACR